MKRNNKKDNGGDELSLEAIPIDEKDLMATRRAKRQLQSAEDWFTARYALRRNVIKNEVESKDTADKHATWCEVDSHSLYRRMLKSGLLFSVPKIESLLCSDFVSNHNPFHAYFTTLGDYKPDETDYIDALASHVKCADDGSWKKHFKKHLVRTVACALQEHYFNKHCLTLIGKQNDGKSTFLRFLTPPALRSYYTENIPLRGDKDGKLALVQNLFINLDELAALSKYDINELKSIFSMTHLKVRPAYEKNQRMFSRVASFLGSTNNKEFLTDSTGSVRWLCFEINDIDFSYSQSVDIDSVWRQAYHLYMQSLDGWKYDYRLTVEEVQRNEEVNAKHQITSVEADLISEHLEPVHKDDSNAMFMTAANVMQFLNTKAPSLKTNVIVIGKIMNSLGFEKSKAYRNDNSLSGYWVREISAPVVTLEGKERRDAIYAATS